jgi:hypothetical protein
LALFTLDVRFIDSSGVISGVQVRSVTVVQYGDIAPYSHPDVVWIESEGIPYGGTFLGCDVVFEGVFAKIAAEWDGFTATVDGMFEADGLHYCRQIVVGHFDEPRHLGFEQPIPAGLPQGRHGGQDSAVKAMFESDDPD